jgi:benzodiazapine receptor
VDTAVEVVTRRDRVRAVALLIAAVGQGAATALGVFGGAGESVETAAGAYTTAVAPAAPAFGIWILISLGMVVLAADGARPSQLADRRHRAVGWWLVGAAVAEVVRVVLLSARLVGVAEVALIALVVCLAATAARLARLPAGPVRQRWTLSGPVALYTGWVAVASLVGTAATGRWLGIEGDGAVSLLAWIVLLAIGMIGNWVADHGRSPAVFTAALIWGLLWILPGGPEWVVTPVLVAVLAVTWGLVRRLATSGDFKVMSAFS